MSERGRYPPGVPCWVDTLQPDVQPALSFYGPLFGWEFVGPGPMPGDPPGQYFVARLKGRDVAGVGSLPGASPPRPAWSTYVRVASADEAVKRARSAGGSVRAGPLDALPAGRMAVLADPAGAPFCVWEAGNREGAQLVNEPRAWSMSSLHTHDAEGSAAFYRAMFGWVAEPFGPPGARILLWRLPGYVGGEPQQPVPRDVVAVLVPSGGDGPAPAAPPRWHVDFWVEDAGATAGRATGLQGDIIVPPHDVPGFRSAVLADPQGAVFAVSQKTAGP
jgi:uncharacterized protein